MFKTGDSGFQLLDLLLLRGQRIALRSDACALLQKLVNPAAQGRFANSKRTTSLNETVILHKYEVSSLAF